MYYFSSIFAAIGCLIMCALALRKDAKILGKKSLMETGQLPVNQVEMEEKTVGENTDASIEPDKAVGVPSNEANVVDIPKQDISVSTDPVDKSEMSTDSTPPVTNESYCVCYQ